jgi:hypothetical protein
MSYMNSSTSQIWRRCCCTKFSTKFRTPTVSMNPFPCSWIHKFRVQCGWAQQFIKFACTSIKFIIKRSVIALDSDFFCCWHAYRLHLPVGPHLRTYRDFSCKRLQPTYPPFQCSFTNVLVIKSVKRIIRFSTAEHSKLPIKLPDLRIIEP